MVPQLVVSRAPG